MNIEVKEKVHEASGLLVRTTGEVFIPSSGRNKSHWTFGCPNSKGYLRVCFMGRSWLVHRLVGEAFLDKISGKLEIDHINRNPRDNRLENLRWVNRSENILNTSQSDEENLVLGIHCSDPEYAKLNQRHHRQKMKELGYKYTRFPDGKRRWVKEDSLYTAA